MKLSIAPALLTGIAAMAPIAPLHAADDSPKKPKTAWEASQTHADDDKIATGVARARDRLDSATSTSSITETEISKLAARSLGDLFRNIPGVRAEAGTGETNASYTIRGLPMVSNGAKYLQFQEDGLPVLEFGDILGLTPDTYIRADFNVAQIESIRGGSASTFASNAPGGVINLISKTGEVEGGSVQASAGLNFEGYRTDFDYGGHLNDTLRFHVGGFYRDGNGPRHVGYSADHGGQVKINVTKEFTGGYIRFYGKYLDDHNASYGGMPMLVSGTNDNPKYSDVPGTSLSDSVQSRFISAVPGIDGQNAPTVYNPRNGYHVIAKSIGFDAKFDVGDWSITERMRYSAQSGSIAILYPISLLPAAIAAPAFGAPGGSLVYASGPLAGQTISSPSTLNGNGLLNLSIMIGSKPHDLNNFTNDLRIGRIWDVVGGDLTTTAGVYRSRQNIVYDQTFIALLQDVAGNGSSSLVDIAKADGSRLTQGGVLSFYGVSPGQLRVVDTTYSVLAPYGSFNFHKGKFAVGASIRVDTGKVEGTARTNAPQNLQTIDIDNNGVISDAERTFPIAPYANTQPINYNYSYVSYSGSVNYRPTDSFSTFARYSRGARAGAERLIFSPAISPTNGSLIDRNAAKDPVKQAELGVKYRASGLALNLTGFWAEVSETNTQVRPNPVTGVIELALVNRSYRAYGAEFEGGLRRGPFSLTANATYTHAEITKAEDPSLVGHTPRHQAKLIFQLTPQYESSLVTVGVNAIGTTSSYAQDENQLKMPGYVTINPFLQITPAQRFVLALNVSNLFDVRALTSVSSASLPASGVVVGQALYGRTISTSARFYF
ncbi:MAG TPA: TonB-dependent receptor [Sphingobium sp.]